MKNATKRILACKSRFMNVTIIHSIEAAARNQLSSRGLIFYVKLSILGLQFFRATTPLPTMHSVIILRTNELARSLSEPEERNVSARIIYRDYVMENLVPFSPSFYKVINSKRAILGALRPTATVFLLRLRLRLA